MSHLEDYDMVMVARSPNQSAAPTLTEVDRFNAVNSIYFEESLNREGNAVISLDPRKQSETIKSRLRDLAVNPSELAIYRGSTKLWQGPITVPQVQGQTLVLNAKGLFYYTKYMQLESTLSFSSVDQWQIARDLIDHYQSLDYGDYGIDVSAVTTSGVTRTRNYTFDEVHVIYDRVIELAEVNNGFDFDVSVADRSLQMYASKGSDLSATVKIDVRPITDANVFWSVAAGEIASEAIAVGYSDDESYLIGTASNTGLRSTFGRCSISDSFSGITSQTTIDDKATKMIAERGEQLFRPGPSLFTVTSVEVDSFFVGDTVEYSYDVGLGLQTFDRRVLRKAVRINPNGHEFLDVEFD